MRRSAVCSDMFVLCSGHEPDQWRPLAANGDESGSGTLNRTNLAVVKDV